MVRLDAAPASAWRRLRPGDGTGPRKDTVILLPGETVTVQFDAANPDRWMTHCRNVYRAESAMMAAVGYLR